MTAVELRDYQIEARENLREAMQSGMRRVVLVAPTAFGKTETAIDLVLRAQAKGAVTWFIVDRVNLVDQTSDRFLTYDIDHGIYQGEHHRYAPEKDIQIWSAQTMAVREIATEPDLIIVDEAHAQYKSTQDLVARCPRAKVIGLTATPFSDGMADQWDGLVNGATVDRLLKLGFLTPLKIKACVSPDMKGARKKYNGEYEEEDAGQRGITIVGDVVQTWVQQTANFFGGPVKTLVFSPSVKHGEELCRQFADAGYNFQQISYLDKSDKDRKAKIDEFRKPNSAIHGLVSCAVLTKGFDVPDVLCGISCRPYRKSFSSHIQELGRVMRIAPGKEFGLWLDHSGNCISFADDTAWLFENGVDTLSRAQKKDSVAREPQDAAKSKHFCRECGLQMLPSVSVCQGCGWERPKRGEVHVVEGQLIDFEVGAAKAYQLRPGLRAECLSDPRAVWNAALAYCFANCRKGEDASRKWAFGIWRGIYPTSKLPYGLYDAACSANVVTADQWGLIEREVKRFRKGSQRRVA